MPRSLSVQSRIVVTVAATLVPVLALSTATVSLGGTDTRLALASAVVLGLLAGIVGVRHVLAHQARYDALTGLPNRVHLADRLQRALARGRRRAQPPALLVVDLDGFQAVNDSLGHGAGDAMLRLAADRLRSCLPAHDVAHLGADEFAVLLEGPRATDALEVGGRVLEVMRRRHAHDSGDLFLTASIGIATATRHSTAETLLRDAALAMHEAKSRGRDSLRVFDPGMRGSADERLRLANDLRGALERGELSLHYQPVYSLGGGAVVAVEALMRWHHPRHGLIPPTEFIPVAEASDLIVSLGAWALDEGCRQLRAWQDSLDDAAADALRLSVNLSARQLSHDGLPGVVAQALATHGIEPHRLMLEITETSMVADYPGTVDRLHHLKALGVQLAIDDFGTGYSSLAYLQQFPVDKIKIDKSFVDRIISPEGEAFAGTIISLARALTMEPIAEGIEHAHQLAALERLGCRLGQGFHLARPESGQAIGRRLGAAARPMPA